MRALPTAAVLAAAIPLASSEAAAEPRFAARQGVPCSLCHQSPNGGGPRTRFGREVYAAHRLPMSTDDFGLGFRPEAFGVDFGGDARFAFIAQDVPEVDPAAPPGPTNPSGPSLLVRKVSGSAFFPMQLDGYAAAPVGRFVTMYADVGAHGTAEAAALVHTEGRALIAALGAFNPPFGLRLANHTSATRHPMGFHPRAKQVGAELTANSRHFGAQAAATGWQEGGWFGDLVAQRAGSVRLEARWPGELLRASVAASLYAERRGAVDDRRAGASATLSLGRLTYLGEVVARSRDADADGPRQTPLAQYHELLVAAGRGLDLSAMVEALDPERGIGRRDWRIGGSASLFLIPNIEFLAFVRRYLAPAAAPEHDLIEAILMLHMYL